MNLKCLVSLSGITYGAAIFLPTCVPAEDTGSGDWDWSAEAYFWGADLGGETTSGSDVGLSIDDILDNLKFAVMAGVGASRGNWALFADALYIDIGASDSATATSGPFSAEVRGAVDLKAFTSTFGAGYLIAETASTKLHATGGIRYLWFDGSVEVDATEAIFGFPIAGQTLREKSVATNWDAVIGLRGTTDFGERWYVSYYADIGTGESDLTWQAIASAGYRMGWGDLVIGYRHLEWDLDRFGPFDELNLGGPFLGAKFTF